MMELNEKLKRANRPLYLVGGGTGFYDAGDRC